MSDVFFLGAGASKAICPSLPLASELTVASLLDRSAYEHDADPGAAIAELQKAIDSGALPKMVLARPLEDALDELPERESPFAREHLLICVMERLSFSTSDTYADLAHWLETVRLRRGTIITTNYDGIIEWALANQGTGVYPNPGDLDVSALGYMSYGVPRELIHDYASAKIPTNKYESLGQERDTLPVLKLHGSLGWSRCRGCQLYFLDPLYRAGAVDAWVGGTKACPNRHCSGETRDAVIVPPVSSKIYSDPAIKEIWKRAEAALGLATTITFAGFSLASTDEPIHRLLRRQSSVPQEVIVVDPSMSDGARCRYQAVYGDRVRFTPQSWSTFLQRRFDDNLGRNEAMDHRVP